MRQRQIQKKILRQKQKQDKVRGKFTCCAHKSMQHKWHKKNERKKQRHKILEMETAGDDDDDDDDVCGNATYANLLENAWQYFCVF